ncbi:MAG: hypothetical protein ACKVRO_06775 [Micropepsaceae bacterium]
MKKYAYLLAASALIATGTLATIAPAQARDRADFSISLGNVVLGYEDGYYDHERRWHRWNNRQQRNWYRQNRRDAYFHMRRNRDRDQYRRGWWQGHRSDWRNYGYGDRGYDRGGVDFSIVLGNAVFAYDDGYYDRDRRWHTWQNDGHRDWYRRNHSRTYYNHRRDFDRDQYRRDWREGRRSDWQYYGDGGYGGYNSGYNGGGSDFAIVLGNVVFAYEDGYYDRDRRWHTWQNDGHRDWYRRNHSRTYYNHRRDRDNDRDWREGHNDRWQF